MAEVLVSFELNDVNAVIINVNAPAPSPERVLESMRISGDQASTYRAQPAALKIKHTVAATRMFVREGGRLFIIRAENPRPNENAPIVHPKYPCSVCSS